MVLATLNNITTYKYNSKFLILEDDNNKKNLKIYRLISIKQSPSQLQRFAITTYSVWANYMYVWNTRIKTYLVYRNEKLTLGLC